jgi:curli biogenesis system outer membrane secretion channel CsgG
MKKWCYSLLLGTIFAIPCLAADELPCVAVGNFINKSTIRNANFSSLVDRMTDAIVNTRKFQVIDNARVKEFVEERQGKIDGGIARNDGNETGIAIAGFLIYGTVMNCQIDKKETQNRYFKSVKITCSIELNLRFSDVASGKILASKTVRGEYVSTRSIDSNSSLETNFEQAAFDGAIQKVSENSCNALMELAYPAKIITINNKKSIYVNLSMEKTIQGDIYEVYKTEGELRDPDTGLSLGAAEIQIARIRIVEIKPKYAIAELQTGDFAQIHVGSLLRKAQIEKIDATKPSQDVPSGRRLLENRF